MRSAADRIQRLRQLAWMLDDLIPLPGGFRVGIDPLLGLIPGVGDFVSALFSVFIWNEARALGAPATLLIRMFGNTLIDAVFGSIPVLGDLFDAAFKGNRRNIELLAKFQVDPARVERSSHLLVAVGVVILLAVLAALVAIPVLLVMAIVGLF